MKTLEGSVIITRPMGAGPERFEITVTDDRSCLVIAEIEIDACRMADCLVARTQPCTVSLNTNPNIGKQRESKEVLVPLPAFRVNEEEAQDCCANFETDGWEALWRDCMNHHNVTKDDGEYHASVIFERWV